MSLVVNTNLSSLIVQKNLGAATTQLNTAIERMSTGYKINHAKDNAANNSIAKNWEAMLSSLDVAAENTAMGIDLLKTSEENYNLISSHLQRVRDLTEQAANGTYGADSLAAIQKEIKARLDEIDRISLNAEYNGITLMKTADHAADLVLQVGIEKTAARSQIAIDKGIFADAKAVDLITITGATTNQLIAESCGTTSTAAAALEKLDAAINAVSTKVTNIGALQNRLESASDSIVTQSQNLTSSLSTIKDTDVANESSNYIKAQILQQASATLLSTANQMPSIALNLL